MELGCLEAVGLRRSVQVCMIGYVIHISLGRAGLALGVVAVVVVVGEGLWTKIM